MPAPQTVHLAWDTALAAGVTVEPNVVFAPGVTVESGAVIRAFSHLEGCIVRSGAIVAARGSGRWPTSARTRTSAISWR